jgi:hypothetical protein
MTHTARLTIVSPLKDVPEELKPFVSFKAGIDGRNLAEDTNVAVLQVDELDSFYPVFLDGKTSLAEIERELGRMETSLDEATRKELEKLLK